MKKAAEAGAIQKLLVTEKQILSMRDKGTYHKLDTVMKQVDSMQGEIHLISSDHEGGKRLDGLGGVGAILRYKVNI